MSEVGRYRIYYREPSDDSIERYLVFRGHNMDYALARFRVTHPDARVTSINETSLSS